MSLTISPLVVELAEALDELVGDVVGVEGHLLGE